MNDYANRDVHLRYDQGRSLAAPARRAWIRALQTRARAADLLAPDLSPQRVLDLGCGTGRFLPLLAEAYPRAKVLGMDPSAKMLSAAHTVSSAHPFVRAASESIPLSDWSCGLVFMSMVYHHLADRDAALQEIHRVLACGGIFALRTCSRENLDTFLYSRFFPQARAIDLARLERASQITQQICANGFELIAHDQITQTSARTPSEYAQRIRLRTMSDLEAISDEDFAAGMTRLEAHCATLDPSSEINETLDFLVFRAA